MYGIVYIYIYWYILHFIGFVHRIYVVYLHIYRYTFTYCNCILILMYVYARARPFYTKSRVRLYTYILTNILCNATQYILPLHPTAIQYAPRTKPTIQTTRSLTNARIQRTSLLHTRTWTLDQFSVRGCTVPQAAPLPAHTYPCVSYSFPASGQQAWLGWMAHDNASTRWDQQSGVSAE